MTLCGRRNSSGPNITVDFRTLSSFFFFFLVISIALDQ